MWTLTTAMQVNVINRAMNTARKEEELELVDGGEEDLLEETKQEQSPEDAQQSPGQKKIALRRWKTGLHRAEGRNSL